MARERLDIMESSTPVFLQGSGAALNVAHRSEMYVGKLMIEVLGRVILLIYREFLAFDGIGYGFPLAAGCGGQ